jgi:hypothetical protein
MEATNGTGEVIEMAAEKQTQLAQRPSALPVVKTPRAVMLAAALEEEREQRILLRKYVDEFMQEGEDYGVIPGTGGNGRDGKKPRRSLLKPGAEKLLDLFRCRPEYEFISRDVDREAGLYSYEMKCKAVSRETDTVLNEGVGSASSYESKYRYRNSSRVCPNCGKDSIIKGKQEYGGGWVCFAKKGGCGAKWEDGAPEIEGQEVGKIQNPDLADLANTVLKMAKKRAQVDCAIALARVSDMFTQDAEDLPGAMDGADEPAAPQRASRPAPRRDAPRRVEAAPVDAARNVTVAAEVLGGKVETPPPPKKGPPSPYVMALWDRLVKQEGGNKKLAKAGWDRAAASVGAPVESKDWTPEHAAMVDDALWPKDVP